MLFRFNIKLVFRTWSYPSKGPPDGNIVVFNKITKTKFHLKIMKFIGNFEEKNGSRVLGVTSMGLPPNIKI